MNFAFSLFRDTTYTREWLVCTKLTFIAKMTYDCSAACKCQGMLPSDRSLLRDAVICSIENALLPLSMKGYTE